MATPALDPTSLRLLVAVADEGSLGRAARAVGLAQPNASRTITRLESSLGLTLLERTPRGSTLTTEGTVIVHWAREVLAATDKLLLGADALRTERSSSVSVSASMTIAEYLVPRWLSELHRRSPDVSTRLVVANSDGVMDRVAGGACEVGFVESPRVRRGLQSATVARDRLVVVVRPGHPWSRRSRPVDVEEVATTPLVVRESGSGTRLTLDTALAAAGHATTVPALELESNAAVRIAVASGAGPAVLSGLAVADPLERGELSAVPVVGLDLERRLRAVWRPPRRLRGAAADLVAVARASLSRGPVSS